MWHITASELISLALFESRLFAVEVKVHLSFGMQMFSYLTTFKVGCTHLKEVINTKSCSG